MFDTDGKKKIGTNSKSSYADAVNNNPMVIIPPKFDQQSTDTRKEVQKNIKPAKKGMMWKKLEREASSKLGDKYEVKISDLRNPQIKIFGISEKMSKEDIIDSLRIQNEATRCAITSQDANRAGHFATRITATNTIYEGAPRTPERQSLNQKRERDGFMERP
ncbi:hypothetical protein CBL_12808 [Carabus blaptoides fortunei]